MYKPLYLKQCLSTPLLWCQLFFQKSVFFQSSNRWGVSLKIIAKMGGNCNHTISTAPGENPNANGLSMKCEGALPTNRQLAHISLTFGHNFLMCL